MKPKWAQEMFLFNPMSLFLPISLIIFLGPMIQITFTLMKCEAGKQSKATSSMAIIASSLDTYALIASKESWGIELGAFDYITFTPSFMSFLTPTIAYPPYHFIGIYVVFKGMA